MKEFQFEHWQTEEWEPMEEWEPTGGWPTMAELEKDEWVDVDSDDISETVNVPKQFRSI